MSVRVASKEYLIPKRTLKKMLCLLELLTVKLGDFCVDRDLERELCVRIYRLTEAGVPLTSKISREQMCSHIASMFTHVAHCDQIL
jgi:hypothetical protein